MTRVHGHVQVLVSIATLVFASSATAAEDAPDVQRGTAVTVTATRTEADPFDVPASIDRIDGVELREGRLQVNLSEGLGPVPGLVLQNRQNYAQDLQLSIRGFGARSTFGIRGVRLYVDGIPATLPDGQGQLSNIDLASVGRIEVLRGPFSALYGNSSGGVVQVFTEDGSDSARIVPSFAGGSDGTWRVALKAGGSVAPGESRDDRGEAPRARDTLSGSRFETRGWREHGAARRDVVNGKLVIDADAATRVTLIANRVDLPRAEDPLGLTRAQFEASPRSVDASAIAFDTRKTFDQTQAGAIVERRVGDDDALRLLVYGGTRNTTQYQAIPVGTQLAATSPGGVIDLERDYAGFDVRLTHRMRVASQAFDVIAGLAGDRLEERRRGYENFVGPPAARTLGVQGALRRDEDNDVRNLDPYLQASWTPDARWTVNGGVRHSVVRFTSYDRYVVTTANGVNPDDSGAVRYRATSPVAGVLYAATPALHLYATTGRGFETPTFNELSYRADGSSGLAFALRPSKSTSVEAGVKARIAIGDRAPLLVNAAVYATRVDDELVVRSNVGGRATYANAGRTRRRGVELSGDWAFAANWRSRVAFSTVDARYRESFLTCVGAPCSTPTVPVAIGNRIPGVPTSQSFVDVGWEPASGLRANVEARRVGAVPVDDANSDAAASYSVANARVGYRWRIGAFTIDAFARIDNAFDRRYAGSVIVNEGNARFFEPAAGRTWLVGATVGAMF